MHSSIVGIETASPSAPTATDRPTDDTKIGGDALSTANDPEAKVGSLTFSKGTAR